MATSIFLSLTPVELEHLFIRFSAICVALPCITCSYPLPVFLLLSHWPRTSYGQTPSKGHSYECSVVFTQPLGVTNITTFQEAKAQRGPACGQDDSARQGHGCSWNADLALNPVFSCLRHVVSSLPGAGGWVCVSALHRVAHRLAAQVPREWRMDRVARLLGLGKPTRTQ